MLNHLRLLRSLLSILKLQRWLPPTLLFLGVLTALSEGLTITLLIPLVQSQSVITVATPQGALHFLNGLFESIPPERRLLVIAGIMIVGLLVKNGLSYGYFLLFNSANASINHRLRCGILAQMLRAKQSFFDQHNAGHLINTLASQTWQASTSLSLVATIVINLCMVVIFGALLLIISWKLTLITLAALLGVSGFIQLLTRNTSAAGAAAATANASLTQRLLEILNGMRLIRMFGREDFEHARFSANSDEVRKTFFRVDRSSMLITPVSEMLIACLLLAILFFAATTPAEMANTITFLVLLYRVHPRIKQIDADRVTLQSLMRPVEEVHAALTLGQEFQLRSGTKRVGRLRDGIRFVRVSLQYEANHAAAIEEVDLTIQPGRVIALVGPSGAGKSSLVSLICRFYDPTAGELSVDGVPIAELDLAWWREQIGMVSQEVHLFNTTIAENIGYGRLEATRAEIMEAARKARADEFIANLPLGLETVLGDRGVRLSGGQRQRLALARAFLRDPQILILDEATNSLDLISESLVQDALRSFGEDRTVIIIAHRISTIEYADEIIVMDAGRIVERGTYESLVAEGGLFSRLHSLQFRRDLPPTVEAG